MRLELADCIEFEKTLQTKVERAKFKIKRIKQSPRV
jgi:hypothetical protein